MFCSKEVATELELGQRTFRRLWKILGIPPTIPAFRAHRWSAQDVKRLKKAWAKYSKERLKVYGKQ